MKISLRTCASFAATCIAMAYTASAFALHQPGHKSGEAWKSRLLGEAPNSIDIVVVQPNSEAVPRPVRCAPMPLTASKASRKDEDSSPST